MNKSSGVLQNRFDWLPGLTSLALALWMIVLTLAPHSAFRPLHIVFHYGLLPLLLAVHCYFRWRTTGILPFRSFSWPDLSMALYLALVFASYLWANKTGSAALHVFAVFRNVFVPFAVFWLIRVSRLRSGEIRIFIFVMVLLSVINICISILAWFKPEYLPFLWPALLADKSEIRITGTFTNPDIFAAALAFYGSFILHDALKRRTGAYRLLLLSICSLAISCIVLTFARTSWIGLAFLLPFSVIVYRKAFVKQDLMALLPGVLLLVLTLAIPPQAVVKQQRVAPETRGQTTTLAMVGQRVGSTSQIRSRILTGYAGLRMFAEKPILGWGYETYTLHAKKFVKPIGSLKVTNYESERAPSHNTFVTMLAETGVLGLFLYTFPLAWWGFLAVRNRRLYWASLHLESFLNSRFFMILWANLAFILFISQSIDIRFFPFTLVQIWLILGLIANLAKPDGEPGPE